MLVFSWDPMDTWVCVALQESSSATATLVKAACHHRRSESETECDSASTETTGIPCHHHRVAKVRPILTTSTREHRIHWGREARSCDEQLKVPNTAISYGPNTHARNHQRITLLCLGHGHTALGRRRARTHSRRGYSCFGDVQEWRMTPK